MERPNDTIKSLAEENRELPRESAELRGENALLRQDIASIERRALYVVDCRVALIVSRGEGEI